MNKCLKKYFNGLEITKHEVVNFLKNLLFECTFDELKELENDQKIPICLQLLIKALVLDLDTGHCNTMNSIIDFVF
jgi:hypothetical protein